MAHYISYSLFDDPTIWITVVILELIHASTPNCLGGRDVFIRSKPMRRETGGIVVSHNNCANRMASRRRWIIQVSALSALDGRVLAYHGFNG